MARNKLIGVATSAKQVIAVRGAGHLQTTNSNEALWSRATCDHLITAGHAVHLSSCNTPSTEPQM